MNRRIVSILALAGILLSVTSILMQVRQDASAAPLRQAASVPHVINYQGRLTDAAGNPLTGSYAMTFALYDVSTGGAALWTESQSVDVAAGVFNVLLGAGAAIPAAVFDNQSLYLGVRVGGDEEMTPRRRVVSAGYAYRAEESGYSSSAGDADTVDGFQSSALLSRSNHTGTQPPSSISPQGTSSGLDADLLDGKHATDLLPDSMRILYRGGSNGCRTAWNNSRITITFDPGYGICRFGYFKMGNVVSIGYIQNDFNCWFRFKRRSDNALITEFSEYAAGGTVKDLDTRGYAGTEAYLEIEQVSPNGCQWVPPLVFVD